MKISQETISILKNYSSINSNIIIEDGGVLRTMAQSKTIMAVANIPEQFPQEVCIYDLNIFLGTLSLFDEPDAEFKEKYMLISDAQNKGKSSKLKYFYAAKNVVTPMPSEEFIMPESFVDFKLEEGDFNKLVRASATLSLEDFAVESDGKRISLTVFNKKDARGCNRFSIDIGAGNGDEYQMIIKVSNLKMIAGTYDVKMSKQAITEFKNVNKDITYYIAIDATSKHN